MRGFTRIFRAETFNATDPEAAKKDGRAVAEAGFANLSASLGEQDYLLGDFSIADAGLFFLEWWGRTRAKLSLPANLDAHYERMLTRPAVQRMMAREKASP
jgi:glutathione S-transferase